MEFFRKIDDVIIDAPIGIQAWVNFIERFIGLKYHAQARIVVILTTAWVINIFSVEFATMIHRGEPATDIGIAIVWNIIVVLLIFSMTTRARKNTDAGRKNPLREGELFFRFIHLFMVPASFFHLSFGSDGETVFLDHITFAGMTLALYLAACDEAPPQRDTSLAH